MPALAQLAGLAISLPLALGGEAESSNSTAIGVISVLSIALGYVGLFTLWWFVFRDKSRSKRKKDSSE